jgi:hypothetical protein
MNMTPCTPVCPLAKVLGWIKPALFSPVELSAPEVGPLTIRPEPMHGMAALCALANRSEATLLDWIRNRDFPAVKVDEEWTADRNQVVDWLKNRLNA